MKAMNVIGIDHQLSVTTIALRETRTTVAGTSVIGDGWYPILYNCVSPEPSEKGKYLLGTAAMAQGGAAVDLDYSQPETVEHFWSALRRILFDYLGRTVPVEANGYCVAITFGSDINTSKALKAMRSAGLCTVDMILPCEALLARRLAAMPRAERASRFIAIAAGDNAITVQAFQVEERTGAEPKVVQRSESVEVVGHGDSTWRNHLLQLLQEKHIEPPSTPLNRNPRVLASLRRLATRMSTESKPVQWDGGQQNLFAPVTVGTQLSSWPGLRSFDLEVRAAIAEVSRALQGGRPQELLVGGVGAEWPFIRDIASNAGPMRASSRPSEDLAVGCCWADSVCWQDTSNGRFSEARSLPNPSLAPARTLPVAVPKGDLPPWERHNFDLTEDQE